MLWFSAVAAGFKFYLLIAEPFDCRPFYLQQALFDWASDALSIFYRAVADGLFMSTSGFLPTYVFFDCFQVSPSDSKASQRPTHVTKSEAFSIFSSTVADGFELSPPDWKTVRRPIVRLLPTIRVYLAR